MPLAFSFATCAMVAAFPAMTLLQAAAWRPEGMEWDDGLVVALGLELVGAGVGAEGEDCGVDVVGVLEADEVGDAVVGVVLEGVGEVERAEVAVAGEADDVEVAVVGVVLEETAAGVLDVAEEGALEAALDTIACGAASAVAAKSRTREVDFILKE